MNYSSWFFVFFFNAGSNCSSGSEGEPTALHAGICVRQQSVSTKDALIAGEALSLLVTCLQLRSQQLGMEKNWIIHYWEYKPGGRRLLVTVK